MLSVILIVVMLSVVMLNIAALIVMSKGSSIPLTLKHAHLAVVTTLSFGRMTIDRLSCRQNMMENVTIFCFLVKYIKSSC
jgi:hypothetical protein